MSGEVPVAVGDVVHVAEPNYKYGTGAMILRITRIGDVRHLSDGAWVELDGTELRADGTALGLQPRHALVRVQGLRRATLGTPGQ